MNLIKYILIICLCIYYVNASCSKTYTSYKDTFKQLSQNLSKSKNSKNVVQISCTNKDIVIICEHKDLAIFKYNQLRDNCVTLLNIIINNDCVGVSCPDNCSAGLGNGIQIDLNQVPGKTFKNTCTSVAS
jgi:hypothetical protein